MAKMFQIFSDSKIVNHDIGAGNAGIMESCVNVTRKVTQTQRENGPLLIFLTMTLDIAINAKSGVGVPRTSEIVNLNVVLLFVIIVTVNTVNLVAIHGIRTVLPILEN